MHYTFCVVKFHLYCKNWLSAGFLYVCMLFFFLSHLSWTFKWVLLISCGVSTSVRPSVLSSVCKFFSHFHPFFHEVYYVFSLKRPLIGSREFKFVKIQAMSFQGGNIKNGNIHWRNLNIFSRTAQRISIKLHTKRPWMWESQRNTINDHSVLR